MKLKLFIENLLKHPE
jgi:hypothetical protein